VGAAPVSQSAVSPRVQAPLGVTVLLRVFALPVLGFLLFGTLLAFGMATSRLAPPRPAVAPRPPIPSLAAVGPGPPRPPPGPRPPPAPRRNLLLTIFSFSYLVFFVVPIFVFYIGDSGYAPDNTPNRLPLTPATVTRAVLAIFGGYVTLLLGYALPLGGMLAN